MTLTIKRKVFAIKSAEMSLAIDSALLLAETPGARPGFSFADAFLAVDGGGGSGGEDFVIMLAGALGYGNAGSLAVSD